MCMIVSSLNSQPKCCFWCFEIKFHLTKHSHISRPCFYSLYAFNCPYLKKKINRAQCQWMPVQWLVVIYIYIFFLPFILFIKSINPSHLSAKPLGIWSKGCHLQIRNLRHVVTFGQQGVVWNWVSGVLRSLRHLMLAHPSFVIFMWLTFFSHSFFIIKWRKR